MLTIKSIIRFSLLVISLNILAADKCVYDNDDRRDLKDVRNPLRLKLARSTAAMIYYKYLKEIDGDTFKINYETLQMERKLCPEVPFAQQINAANCSGFLVGEDLLLTAGHCVETIRDCQNYRWVFDYSITDKNSDPSITEAENIYRCQEIVARVLSTLNKNDFSLIRLNRKVTKRPPLKFRTEGRIEKNTKIFVIGHPDGLPTKISDHAIVRSNSRANYFVTNLDTFAGNSGSAVFNATNSIVEGILVRGDDDYERDFERKCYKAKLCVGDDCRGEDVTRITKIAEIIKKFSNNFTK